jgi:hypothetical protein
MTNASLIPPFTLGSELLAFSSQTEARPRAMLGATADTPDAPPATLFDMLHTDAKAPSSTTVAVIPTQDGAPTLSSEQMQELQDVMMLTSFISVASMRRIYQTVYAKNPPDITTPAGAALFVQSAANAKNFVLTSALGGYLSLNTSAARSFKESTTSADLHLGFLTTLFDGFNFPPATIKELDGVLSSVTQTLDSLKMSWSDQSSTLDHMIFVYYFEAVAGLEPVVKIPKVRLYFLHIDQSSWTASVGKSSVSHIEFNMNFIDSVYDMDVAATAADRASIKALLHTLTGQDMDALNQLLSPKTVKQEGG